MFQHVKDIPALISIESSLRQAAQFGIVADADFATDQATTLANIDARNTNARPELRPQVLAAKEAVKLGFNLLGAATMTTDLATIYTEIQNTTKNKAEVGFAVAV
jgi:hypothetical protein